MRIARIFAFASLALLALGAAALARAPLTHIPLEWRPTTELGHLDVPRLDLAAFEGIKVQVMPFADGRSRGADLIGENREEEDGGEVLKVTTSANVPEFCSRHFADLLRRFGVPVVAAGGTVRVGGQVLDFFVDETNTYHADVRFKVTVNQGGKTLWNGLLDGSAERFGRSLKPENYYETLSDAFLEAVARGLKDPAFVQALAGKKE